MMDQEMKERARRLRRNQTSSEKRVWALVRKCGPIYEKYQIKFRRQVVRERFILDFYCPKLKLAIEVDGGYHDEPEQARYDKWRQEKLEDTGITFLRIRNEDTLDEKVLFDNIEQFLLENI